jgi:hypothetical protein
LPSCSNWDHSNRLLTEELSLRRRFDRHRSSERLIEATKLIEADATFKKYFGFSLETIVASKIQKVSDFREF